MLVGLVATLAGLLLLARAADVFVEGAAALAARFDIPAVVIGAVFIGIGTSVPELLVSGLAAAQGEREIGVGNVVGSNIANLTLVLGCGALITPIRVRSQLLRREVPLSTLAVILFAVAAVGGPGRADGALLLVALVVVLGSIVLTTMRGRGDALATDVERYLEDDAARSTGRIVARLLAGLAGTVAGSQALVWGASRLGRELRWSDAFIGLTVVAVGTSLPELVTAVAAARRGEDELIVGNVLGSNLFNSLAVGGMLGLVSPGPLDDRRLAIGGMLLMLGVALFAGAVMARGGRVTRVEALVLLAVYAVAVPLLG